MTNIYVLDQSFNLLGVIDEFVSIIWRPSYSDIGDFEIYLGATDKAVALLSKNNYVVRSSDVIEDENGNVTYKKVMIIKNVNLKTDVENGDYLTVTGRELKFLLHQRIVWKQTTLIGTAENAIRRLVDENAINPSNSNRVIPGLVLGNTIGFAHTIEKQITGDYLDKAVVDICSTYSYGWDVYIHNDNLVLELYQGVDRSYNQSERPFVVFSDNYENLYNTEYQLNSEEYANTTLIGGEGEGSERRYRTVNDHVGLERFEVFTDARDISQNKDSEDAIGDDEYNNLLDQRGIENLKTLNVIEGFVGEVLTDMSFEYGIDFYLGDIVTIVNKYGISETVQVLSAIESEDENGVTLIPQFANENNASGTGSGGSSGGGSSGGSGGGNVSVDQIYPVGSIYMSINSTNPANLFGGVWEQLKDRFLLGAGDTYSAGSSGGEATHTLTVNEMPSHSHTAKGWAAVPDGSGSYITLGGAGSSTTYSTNVTGGSQPHNNMPPYLAVYMWQRTA